MSNDVRTPQGGDGVPRSGGQSNRSLFSLRSLQNCMRIVSSGASTAASTLRSAGTTLVSSIANHEDDAGPDQVHWAGFDKLEFEGGVLRQVLLLAYRSGFQVWDVEKADDVRLLASRHDGPVSFMQVQKNPIKSNGLQDNFADFRPLLIVACEGSFSGSGNSYDATGSPPDGTSRPSPDLGGVNSFPTFVQFYSLVTHDYVYGLRFRSPVYTIRCSPRVVALSLVSQIHCLDATTLKTEYTVLTCPVFSAISGSEAGYGPLAVGPRWLAYSASPVPVSDTSHVIPQLLSPVTGALLPSSNGSLVAHYAKESSKQLAASIITLGDMGYKKLSKYCSEFLSNNNNATKLGNSDPKADGINNGQIPYSENTGMVIVRDIVTKQVIVQFRAHTSPISALCFDPSGLLLVTASTYGRNINVFRIMPSLEQSSSESHANGTYFHLYKLRRGITNAVIKDISFSDDSKWIMISSSRGTSHLFAMSPNREADNLYNMRNSANTGFVIDSSSKTSSHWSRSSSLVNLYEKCPFLSGPPVSLSAVSRIWNGSNGLKGAVRGAAAFATGVVNPISEAVASAFHNCQGCVYSDTSSLWGKYFILVFSPSGSIIQYVVHRSCEQDFCTDITGLNSVFPGSSKEADSRFVVEALQKWDVCHKRSRGDHGDSVDIYGDGKGENTKFFYKGVKKGTSRYPANCGPDGKAKISAEENRHFYISEMELQMHDAQVPLWSKSGIRFQVMVDGSVTEENDSAAGGEIEIERIPTRVIETRSKDLIPVFDLPPTGFQQIRLNAPDINRHGTLLRQKSGYSEDDRFSCRSSCPSLDSMTGNAIVADLQNGIDKHSLSHCLLEDNANEGAVNNSTDNPNLKSQLKFVNSNEDLTTEAWTGCVNTAGHEDGCLFGDL